MTTHHSLAGLFTLTGIHFVLLLCSFGSLRSYLLHTYVFYAKFANILSNHLCVARSRRQLLYARLESTMMCHADMYFWTNRCMYNVWRIAYCRQYKMSAYMHSDVLSTSIILTVNTGTIIF